jgi:tRNA threonylcarbamoyladenosine biosynthesis protein TsaE
MTEHLIELAEEADTLTLGASLAAGAKPGRVLYLSGELGSGKTTLARGLIGALGHSGRVKSPSYTLVEVYELARLNLYHFDFYRFRDKAEWVSSGFREYFGPDAVCIVEWPERAAGLLAPADLEIELQLAGTGRRARVLARSAAGADWLQSSRSPSRSS